MQTWLGAILFFTVILGTWGGIHFYLYYRITRTFDAGPRTRHVLKIALPILASLYFVGRVIQGRVHEDLGTAVIWPGAVYLALMAVFLSLFLLFDLGFALPYWLVNRRAIRAGNRRNLATAVARWFMPIVAVVSLAACTYGTIGALNGPLVSRIEIRLADLPHELDGFRLVHLSDVHVGGLVGHGYLHDVLEKVAPLEADLVVVTGDISDERGGGDGTAIGRIAAIPSTHGVLSVAGNHEYYTGGDTTIEAYRRYGLPVLRQEHVVVAGGLVVAGVDDPVFLGGPTLADEAITKTISRVPDGLPIVLLAHQPLGVEEAAAAGVDLMLCGHTHGGQVPPFHLFSKVIYGYFSGLYRVDDLQLYVSNGAGFWGPATRLFADPEIVLITLRAL